MNNEAKTKKQLIKELEAKRLQVTQTREDESSVRLPNQYQEETENVEEYFGIRSIDWIGKKTEEIWPPEIAALVKQNDKKVPNGNIVQSITERPQKGDLHKWMDHRFPIKRSNQPPLIGGISVDITRSIGIDEKLQESEELFRTLFDHSHDCVYIHDFDGNFIDANPAALNLLGCKREDIVSLNLSSRFDNQQREIAGKTITELKKKGVQKEAIEYKFETLDGKHVHVETMASLIYRNKAPYAILGIARDVTERKLAEKELRKHRDHLEVLVKERTSELAKINKQLLVELAERHRAEAALRKKSEELKIHANKLEELNVALKILLKQRDADKGEMEEKIMSNVKELLLPYLEELKERPLDAKSKVILNILEANLHGITSSFTHKLSSKYLSLTPREIQIADFIRQEKSTKEISSITGISISSINIHRNHIRTKLGIIAKKINLKSHLQSFS